MPPRAAAGSAAGGETRTSAATTCGSNCVPAQRISSAMRLAPRARRAVGPVGRHRAVGVARADDARDERDLLAGEPVGVAVAVPVLVARADEPADVRRAGPPTARASARPRSCASRSPRAPRRSSGPGLLMISDGMRILPTSCSSATNSASRRSAAPRPSSSADAEHEVDDVAAVAAGVGVVGLDDVAEQERGAAVRVAELERVVDALLPLAREVAEQRHERQDEQRRARRDALASRTRRRGRPARAPRRRVDEPHGAGDSGERDAVRASR